MSPSLDPTETLAQLLGAVARGDVGAFDAVYSQLAPRVFGLTSRILADIHQAEEVTQEVFLEIWQSAASFDPGRGTAASWAMTIAHHRAVDRVRSSEASRRREAREIEQTRTIAVDDTAIGVGAAFEAHRIRRALDTLNPVQRRALELAYFGGFTHLEVSRLMQIPLGTAKGRIRDGLLRLRDSMQAWEAEPA